MSSPSVPRKKVRRVQGWREIKPRTRWATAKWCQLAGKEGEWKDEECQISIRSRFDFFAR